MKLPARILLCQIQDIISKYVKIDLADDEWMQVTE